MYYKGILLYHKEKLPSIRKMSGCIRKTSYCIKKTFYCIKKMSYAIWKTFQFTKRRPAVLNERSTVERGPTELEKAPLY